MSIIRKTLCVVLILFTIFGVRCGPTNIDNSPAYIGDESPQWALQFEDDFETDKGWGIFEEIVGGNP